MAPETTVTSSGGLGLALAERLEHGEVVYFPICPFAVPEEDEHRFLLEQRLASRAHKNIGYNPHTDKVTGYLRHSAAQAERLRQLLAGFSITATDWLAASLPRYASGWQLDRVSFRPEEESSRRLRLTARNDLLHVDAFPSRPTNGWRILRLFVNVNETKPRIWITADTFPALLTRFGAEVGLPRSESPGWTRRVGAGFLRLFQPDRRQRSPYDEFMLRLHNFLKANADYQTSCRKRVWHFPPGSAWMVLTDTATHAALRGRFALEHSYFLDPQTLALPDESPALLLARACGAEVLRAAA
jgi:3-deoxy-D-manno-oct-2-ulosonic acid (Kdo) hydroxylase